jgi:hypothetical protein
VTHSTSSIRHGLASERLADFLNERTPNTTTFEELPDESQSGMCSRPRMVRLHARSAKRHNDSELPSEIPKTTDVVDIDPPLILTHGLTERLTKEAAALEIAVSSVSVKDPPDVECRVYGHSAGYDNDTSAPRVFASAVASEDCKWRAPTKVQHPPK